MSGYALIVHYIIMFRIRDRWLIACSLLINLCMYLLTMNFNSNLKIRRHKPTKFIVSTTHRRQWVYKHTRKHVTPMVCQFGQIYVLFTPICPNYVAHHIFNNKWILIVAAGVTLRIAKLGMYPEYQFAVWLFYIDSDYVYIV